MPKKPIFGVFLRRFYGHALRPPQCHVYIFCQMKGLMKIHNRAKFQLRSICGSQVINFQMFSGPRNSHELGHFGGFLGPNSPKNASILLKIAPEVDLKEINTVLEFLEEISSFKPKNQLFGVFWEACWPHPATP